MEVSKLDMGGQDALWLARNPDPVTSIVLGPQYVYLAAGCRVLRVAR